MTPHTPSYVQGRPFRLKYIWSLRAIFWNDDVCLKCAIQKASLNVSLEERRRIEIATREQARNSEWFIVRSKTITRSKCGRILNQKKKSVSLIRECLYRKPLEPPPKPIAWGRCYEFVAINKHVSQMSKFYENIKVEKCGFIIHPEKGLLGTSPDGYVRNAQTGVNQQDGILEIKCPYSKRQVSPEEACSDSTFFVSWLKVKFS